MCESLSLQAKISAAHITAYYALLASQVSWHWVPCAAGQPCAGWETNEEEKNGWPVFCGTFVPPRWRPWDLGPGLVGWRSLSSSSMLFLILMLLLFNFHNPNATVVGILLLLNITPPHHDAMIIILNMILLLIIIYPHHHPSTSSSSSSS